MKYLVVECHLSYAVVLDEEGRFLRTANLHYEVGQMVTDIIEMQIPDQQSRTVKRTKHRWISSLAAIAACLLMMVIPLRLAQRPYASVYMTINPEVRIDVNRNDVVVGLDGINSDGLDLIKDYQYRRKPLDLVMDELVDKAIDIGFLHEGGQITLTLDAGDGEWVVNRGDTLSAHLNDHLSGKLSVTIEVKDTAAYKHEVILPVEPGTEAERKQGDSGYGESDYGETTAAEQTHAPLRENTASNDDGIGSDYGSAENDGQSGYGGAGSNYGQTDYSDADSDDGQSDYNDAEGSDGQTDYSDSNGDDDGLTDYGNSAGNNGQSSYDIADAGGQSDYHQTGDLTPDSNDGQSSYDQNDDNNDGGQSDYDGSDYNE